jgi:hypothetical protein
VAVADQESSEERSCNCDYGVDNAVEIEGEGQDDGPWMQRVKDWWVWESIIESTGLKAVWRKHIESAEKEENVESKEACTCVKPQSSTDHASKADKQAAQDNKQGGVVVLLKKLLNLN